MSEIDSTAVMIKSEILKTNWQHNDDDPPS